VSPRPDRESAYWPRLVSTPVGAEQASIESKAEVSADPTRRPHRADTGDTVVVEGRFVGTHTGPLTTDDGDVEPTGASVDLRFADVSRVRDGLIVSYHTYYDQLGLLTQLGLMADG
jgi:ketosteroid isomerase-like protein